MIVFNLSCAADHKFEGWFASGEDFDAQRDRGLLSCPLCGSADVVKQLSAPRLNLHAQSQDVPARKMPVGDAAAQPVAMLSATQQQALAELVRQVVENTEDVGQDFAEEARRIHYKEAEVRAIRGVATREEAQALAEEGIEVAPLPMSLPDKSQLN